MLPFASNGRLFVINCSPYYELLPVHCLDDGVALITLGILTLIQTIPLICCLPCLLVLGHMTAVGFRLGSG